MLGVALSAKFSVAFSPEVVEGLNVTMTVQLPPATTWDAVEHVLVEMLKSAPLAPVIFGLLVKFSAPLPVFMRVAVIGALVTPCVTLPKGRDPGRLTTGAVPVPVSMTLCMLPTTPLLLSVKLIVAFSAVAVEGVKVSTTTQLEPMVTGEAVEQVVIATTMLKSAAFAPMTAGVLEKVSDALPVFMRVTVI